MAIADGAGLPIAVCTASASPHEVTLVASTLRTLLTAEAPEYLIGDAAYESDRLDAELAPLGIAMIAPPSAQQKTSDARWPTAPALPPALESRASFRLAAKFPPPGSSLRVSPP